MRRRVRASILSAGLFFGAAEQAYAAPNQLPSGPQALTGVDPKSGERIALDPSAGPIHLAFMATWCRPCIAELPRLADLEDRWKADGYRLFLVALETRQSVERLRAFLAEGPVPGRLVFDDAGGIAKALSAGTVPTHVLVNRQGAVVARSGALDAPFVEALERLIRQQGRPPR